MNKEYSFEYIILKDRSDFATIRNKDNILYETNNRKDLLEYIDKSDREPVHVELIINDILAYLVLDIKKNEVDELLHEMEQRLIEHYNKEEE